MVGAVRPQDGPAVRVVQLPEPLESLMNIHVVDKEINEAVNGNADAHKQPVDMRRSRTDDVTGGAWNGKD